MAGFATRGSLVVIAGLVGGLWLGGPVATAHAGGPERATVRRPERATVRRPERATVRRPERATVRRPERVRLGRSRRVRGSDRALLRDAERLRLRGTRSERPARAALDRALGPRESRGFLRRVLAHERRFYQPGVSYDRATGLTFDGHPVNIRTGKLRGAPRNWSAASKESLHIILLTRAVEGDPVAQALITPDPAHPEKAVGRALDVLGKKIDSYRTFDREHPGFGGFLPWFQVKGGKMEPTSDWNYRVPGLDNGQLAWSLYMAERALREHGHPALADRYGAQLQLMKDNVVRIFYDPKARQLRAEAKIARGEDVAPGENHYQNNQPKYLLDDAYEGLMLVHFADMFGDWSQAPTGAREAVWRTPRRRPAHFDAGGREVTVAQGHWFSSHEQWGFLVLPYRDVPVADRLFTNAQRVRTQFAAENGQSGLFASTHHPVSENTFSLGYESAAGIQEVAKEKVRGGEPIFAPYAAFPVALVDRSVFAGWLESMVDRPGMFGPYGIGESYSEDGKSSPVLTWDGKALPMIGLMGGVGGEIGRYMKEDGVYRQFIGRVKQDYRLFDGVKIHGDDVPLGRPAKAGAR